MPTALLFEKTAELLPLRLLIEKYCPGLEIAGQADTSALAQSLLQKKKPDLIFMNPEHFSCDEFQKSPGQAGADFEIIFVCQSKAFALEGIRHRVVGYLFMPIANDLLISTVETASSRIREKEQRRKDKFLLEKLLYERSSGELIGIPTIEGYEFIFSHEIIRCEGLQKCTRVVTTSKTDIISSYNIGEFRKLLEPYNFFSPHKSYLVNLSFIKKYRREGTILLRDNSNVPISKRKKSEFLERIVHL